LWKRVGIFGDNTPKSITLQKLENLKMIHIAFNVDIVSFFGEFSHCGDQKQFEKQCKSCHILREKESHCHLI